MHVQIVNFRLRDLDDAGYRSLCDDLAPAFAAVPGLTSKIWLADPATGTYGGVYLWEDEHAMTAFAESELMAAVLAHPNLVELTSRTWDVLDAPTALTSRIPASAG